MDGKMSDLCCLWALNRLNHTFRTCTRPWSTTTLVRCSAPLHPETIRKRVVWQGQTRGSGLFRLGKTR